MKRSNLLFFTEQIVDLSIANQSLCDERRKNETRIKELEDSIISHQQRINELIDGNKCDKEELNKRIKELEKERDMYFQKHVDAETYIQNTL
tara:strand:+ start:87 stop:362 length:276 start_codon:yes stop_codon:yes gene_type:complete